MTGLRVEMAGAHRVAGFREVASADACPPPHPASLLRSYAATGPNPLPHFVGARESFGLRPQRAMQIVRRVKRRMAGSRFGRIKSGLAARL
jgi:hypothetical protein